MRLLRQTSYKKSNFRKIATQKKLSFNQSQHSSAFRDCRAALWLVEIWKNFGQIFFWICCLNFLLEHPVYYLHKYDYDRRFKIHSFYSFSSISWVQVVELSEIVVFWIAKKVTYVIWVIKDYGNIGCGILSSRIQN